MSQDASQQDAGRFDSRWTNWIVAQLLDGRGQPELVQVMIRRGFTPAYAGPKVAQIAASDVLAACMAAHRGPAKLAELVSLLGTLFARSGFTLEKRALAPEAFFRDYFLVNRAVVLTGLTEDWPAVRLWGPEYFRSRFGDERVEITHRRDADRCYERNFGGHRTTVRFADYVTMVERGAGNDQYLVARNHVLELPGFAELKNDFRCFDGILDPLTAEVPYVRLWFGPAGTLTPLHCDDRSVLFVQVTGRKQVKMIAPYFLGSLYNDDRCYSPVELDSVDLDRFPAMRDVPVVETVLEPGECLFIPLGWWHWVRSLEISTSLTFTNFLRDEPPLIWRLVMR
jgi:hypothetical protein